MAHKKLVALLTAAIGLGCVHIGASRTAATASDSDAIAVARAVGARIRFENGKGFVVFPRFLDVREDSPVPADARQSREAAALLEAFREGGKTEYADTLAFMNRARLAQLPDSATWWFTLASRPSIRGDSATVEISGGRAIAIKAPVELEVLQYDFVRRGAGWSFVRRSILYAT